MNIGILGAPGAGKSEFAAKLDIELSKHGHDPYLIVDNYVTDLRKDTGLEYGEFGNFIDDMQVVFKRRECELMYSRNDQNTITCGTVLDSVAHNFVRVEEAARTRAQIALTTERLKAIAAAFGLVYTEAWDYDYAFYLPSKGLLDRTLVSLITTYRAPIFFFNPEVTDDKRVSTAANALITLEAPASEAAAEQRVRPGSEDGEADGDSSQPVPDVSE